jgi:hypothetical protein
MSAPPRPVYRVLLRAERGEGVQALKWLLKTALRQFGLRAIEIIEIKNDDNENNYRK